MKLQFTALILMAVAWPGLSRPAADGDPIQQGSAVRVVSRQPVRLAEAETGSAGKATAGEQPSLTICLQDANPLKFAILSQAEAVTTKIYAGIGIRIRWRVGDPSKREGGAALLLQFDSDAPASIPGGAAAYATPFAHRGVTIHILYTRALSTDPKLVSLLLGHVMAHEVGHVLERTDRHSATGVMKAHWGPSDFDQMLRQPLSFEASDVETIRQYFSAR